MFFIAALTNMSRLQRKSKNLRPGEKHGTTIADAERTTLHCSVQCITTE